MSKNIEMNYKIDSGYEVIYPSTLGDLVTGQVADSNKLNGYTYEQIITNVQSTVSKIVTGSYNGTGTYGPNNKTKISFSSGVASFLIIVSIEDSGLDAYPYNTDYCTNYINVGNSSISMPNLFLFNGTGNYYYPSMGRANSRATLLNKIINLYNSITIEIPEDGDYGGNNAECQFNKSGVKYNYCIGIK